MPKIVKILLNNEIICDNAVVMESYFDRLRGLMFRLKPKGQKVLIFKNANWIHSFFCFFKFDAIYIDDNSVVRAYKCNIPPFLILKPVLCASSVIEVVNGCFDIKIGDKIVIDER